MWDNCAVLRTIVVDGERRGQGLSGMLMQFAQAFDICI